jgi:hypothetical protein
METHNHPIRGARFERCRSSGLLEFLLLDRLLAPYPFSSAQESIEPAEVFSWDEKKVSSLMVLRIEQDESKEHTAMIWT